eukprot:gene11851-14956_t
MSYNIDPTTKMLRSGFSKQVVSDDRTEPAFGFGTSHRDNYQKTKTQSGNNSQGAVYKYQSAIGIQPESKYESSSSTGFGSSSRSVKYDNKVPGPGSYAKGGSIGIMAESKHSTSERPVFGSSTRDGEAKVWLDETLMKTTMGKNTPGPNSYKQPGGVGKQVEGKYDTLPSWKLGTETRFNNKDGTRDFPGAGTDGTRDFPGAGAYGTGISSMGIQPSSSKKTLPNPKIGTSTRDAANKVFISKEHEKGMFGRDTPGPTTAPRIDSVGNQTLSAKRTNPSFGFGTAKRDNGKGSTVPGPGSYWA